LLKGTTTGTTTDSDGGYTLSLSDENAVLVFSFIGYETQEVTVGDQSVINVALLPNIASLAEVVVIGYGEQRREAVTGSVVSISGNTLREVPSANITQALQGRLPGVEMVQTSSRPGAGMQIRIRGTRSLTASNDPLVVLDGIPFAGSINDIDPNSIKSVDILKDASATAIYGSRGANGVILITTQRGQKGQKTRVAYNTFYGVKDVYSRYPMMNGPQFAKLRAEALRTVTELGKGATYPNSADESNDVNTDWQDLLYRKGRMVSHDLNISKGSDKGNFSVGVGYYNEQAVIPTNQYTRMSLRAALDQEVGKHFRFGLTTNNSYGFTQGGQVNVGEALGSSPLASPYDADGKLKRATFASQDAYRVWTRDRIENLDDLWLSETKTLGSYNNMYGEVKIPGVEGLQFRVNLGLNIRTSMGGSFTGKGVTNATDPNAPSSASINHSLTTNWAIENLLTYDRVFGKHDISAVALYSAQENKYNSSAITARDLPADHFQYYNLGFAQGEVTINPDDQDYTLSGLVSWMGRVMYAYDDKYMISATLRSDASSVLAPGHKWHTYPAVSVGWNIANESFMENITPFNALKLRVGYGETSNQAVGPYATLGRLDTRPYNFGAGESGYATGYYISELPNENLGWEFTETWNVGIDFGLFEGRLNGTIEYYKQHTKDILLRVDLPSTTGVGSYMANIGETENKGLELSLDGVIIKSDDPRGFTLEAGVNFYANRNELLALTSGQERNEGNWWFVGHPINVIFDYERTGLWQEEDPYLSVLEPGGNVGMIKVKYTGDFNPDGTPVRPIGAADRQIIPFDPKFQGGFNTRLAYKGFDLSVVGAFKHGGTIISTLYGSSSYLNLLSARHNNVNVDYWTPENRDAKYPRPGGITAGDNPKYGSTLGYFDGSYLKIRTISLGYNFTKSNWMEKAGIDQLRLYFTAQNPFVMFSPYHKESGMDPETNSYGDQNQAVNTAIQSRFPVVANNVPSTRNYLIGLNLTF
jgi:TonB-dependent starch-binding outer membrane protein SusC